MPDCFSLPNAAELVVELKCFHTLLDDYAEANVPYTRSELDCIVQAEDAIEQLVTKCSQLEEENAKLKKERDELIKEVVYIDCYNCKYYKTENEKCSVCDLYYSEWEWRGVQK